MVITSLLAEQTDVLYSLTDDYDSVRLTTRVACGSSVI